MLSTMMRPRARLVEDLRRLLGRPRLVGLTALLQRARTVRPAATFALREGLRQRGISVHRLRDNGLRVVKMDIEGGEWAILGDRRFQQTPLRALVLEYHPRMCPTPDPRVTVEALLSGAGLRLHLIWHRADGHGMLWAWQS
jgi:hypothetical protein